MPTIATVKTSQHTHASTPLSPPHKSQHKTPATPPPQPPHHHLNDYYAVVSNWCTVQLPRLAIAFNQVPRPLHLTANAGPFTPCTVQCFTEHLNYRISPAQDCRSTPRTSTTEAKFVFQRWNTLSLKVT